MDCIQSICFIPHKTCSVLHIYFITSQNKVNYIKVNLAVKIWHNKKPYYYYFLLPFWNLEEDKISTTFIHSYVTWNVFLTSSAVANEQLTKNSRPALPFLLTLPGRAIQSMVNRITFRAFSMLFHCLNDRKFPASCNCDRYFNIYTGRQSKASEKTRILHGCVKELRCLEHRKVDYLPSAFAIVFCSHLLLCIYL